MKAVTLAVFAVVASQAIAQTSEQPAAAKGTSAKPALGTWGIDLTNMDTSVKPGDDFYRYVNGLWLAENHIPEDRSSWGSFAELQKLSEERVNSIIDELSASSSASSPEAQKIRDLYNSFADQAGIEQRGLAPAKADLDRLGRVSSYEEIAKAMGDPMLALPTPYNLYIDVDPKNPERYAVNVTQGGLGLPDRDYYLRDDEQFPEIRKQYVAAIGQMLTLAKIAGAEQKAQAILDLEHALAEVQWPADQRRDAEKTYNPVTREELIKLAPQFPWNAFFESAYLGKQPDFIANEKDAFPKMAAIFRKTPVETWQAYLQFHYLQTFAAMLPKAIDDANFAFFGTVLSNQPAQLPRTTRGVRFVSAQLGEAVGKLYVERYFPASSKAQMEALVDNLRAAFAERVKTLEWMSDETKKAALRKLDQFTVKIAYPDTWRDYGALRSMRRISSATRSARERSSGTARPRACRVPSTAASGA
jgi:predicted metalloendopeptidase